ncbi:MAG TPA: penicillin-binding protein 1C, partial [Myxococcaceae bacterium]|nr:penicillin-binding protein 1C [Myxococcaceae bacterium]
MTALLGASAIAVTAAFVWLVPLPVRLTAAPSTVMLFRDGTVAHASVSPDGRWRLPVSLEAVDPAYVRALLRLEDKRFSWHPGVDPVAMARAAALNALRWRRVSGGSTLTMQLVRVLEPRPRTLRSKLVEMARALQMELRLSKNQILTAYLQFVPYGRNLEGVEAGAVAYFGHRANHLSPSEIATLLAVPQDPNRRFPHPRHRARLTGVRDELAARLIDADALVSGTGSSRLGDPALLAQVRSAPSPDALRPFPRRAPHLAAWLTAQEPGRAVLPTTLDSGLQGTAERVMALARAGATAQGIHNGAALLVDHATSEVRAAVGNFDFGDSEHGGQIVGFQTPRSPGSALKPLLYAMAIESGLAGPDFLVHDVPTLYGTYAPKNFDGQFSGLVRLEEALSRSLNLPFVNLLQRIGVPSFVAQLERMGVSSLQRESGWYGLSMAVGGLEVTPAEVAALYAVLAQGGRTRPLRWLSDAQRPERVAVLSPGAAWLTRQALGLKDRPDFPARRDWTQSPPHIHWKTGTSYGHRDAWAVGSGPDYTALVWMGNFDNAASLALVGAEATGPVMFDLLEAVADRAHLYRGDPPPADLIAVEVCATSGHRPGPACPVRQPSLALRSQVPTEPCPYHAALDVDVRTGEALTPACRGGRAYETRSFTVWPT